MQRLTLGRCQPGDIRVTKVEESLNKEKSRDRWAFQFGTPNCTQHKIHYTVQKGESALRYIFDS